MAVQADRQTVERFLSALFPEVPEGSCINLWTLKGRRSHYCTSVDEAVSEALDLEVDVYTATCLAPRGLPATGKTGRCTAANVTRLNALWLDIDIGSAGHKGKSYPPDHAAAVQLLQMLPHYPTLVVNTGNGIHAWWLLHEPVDIDDDNRERLAGTVRGWNKLAQRKALTKDWSVDSVFDLARIMRVPGLPNNKGDAMKETSIVEFDESRTYDLSDFDEFIVAEDRQLELSPTAVTTNAAPKTSRRTNGDGVSEVEVTAGEQRFTLRPDASPPFEKFQIAMNNLELFKETYERERKDFKDGSLSVYDLSLASQCYEAGWTDQEIVDLLVHFRRKNGKPKLRPDYFIRTLHKARRRIDQEEAAERIEETIAKLEMRAEAGDPLNTMLDTEEAKAFREQALADLSSVLGIPFLALYKTTAEEPTYYMKTIYAKHRTCKIGPVQYVRHFGNFADAVYKHYNIELAQQIQQDGKKKKVNWPPISQLIANACEPLDVGDEATLEGRSQAWIEAYVEDCPPSDLDINPDAEPKNGYPFVKLISGERMLNIHGAHFKHWLKVSMVGERVTHTEVGMMLGQAVDGCKRVIRLPGGKQEKRWSIPEPQGMRTISVEVSSEQARLMPDAPPIPTDEDLASSRSDQPGN